MHKLNSHESILTILFIDVVKTIHTHTNGDVCLGPITVGLSVKIFWPSLIVLTQNIPRPLPGLSLTSMESCLASILYTWRRDREWNDLGAFHSVWKIFAWKLKPKIIRIFTQNCVCKIWKIDIDFCPKMQLFVRFSYIVFDSRVKAVWEKHYTQRESKL